MLGKLPEKWTLLTQEKKSPNKAIQRISKTPVLMILVYSKSFVTATSLVISVLSHFTNYMILLF